MTLLEEFDTAFGNIQIIESGNGTITYYQNGYSQSEADAAGISTCSYIHVLSDIITQSNARRVLIIGCAGGTLATLLHHAGHAVTVVDINPHAFTLAKRYFRMPDAVCCLTGDGYAYLQNAPNYYDTIVVDVFGGDGQVPEHFMQPDFFRTVHHVLAQNGMLLMNVILPEDDTQANAIAHHMELAGLPAVLFDWATGSDRNVIIAGGNSVANIRLESDKHNLSGLRGRKPVTEPA